MNSTVRRHCFPGVDVEWPTSCVRHSTARLDDDQRARADVPRRQPALPVSVEPAATDQAKIERRAAEATARARRPLHVRPLGEVVVRIGRQKAGDSPLRSPGKTGLAGRTPHRNLCRACHNNIRPAFFHGKLLIQQADLNGTIRRRDGMEF